MANMTHTINMGIKTTVFLQTNTVIRIFSNLIVFSKQLSFHMKIFVKSTSSVGNIEADPHPDPGLQQKHNQDLYKKRILYQIHSISYRVIFDNFQGADFKYDNFFVLD